MNKLYSENNIAISVIMSVYNGERFLTEAIESILNQTFTNFEFIIVDDGSTDMSPSIIKSFTDSRIKYFRQENKGLASGLNFCINHSMGKYTARIDDDDIASTNRLQKQYDFLEMNHQVIAVGSWANWIDEKGKYLGISKWGNNSSELKKNILHFTPVPHAGSLYRTAALKKIGGYKDLGKYFYDEDSLLMIDLAKMGEFYNLQEVLNSFRISMSSNSQKGELNYDIQNEIVQKYYENGVIDYEKIKIIHKSHDYTSIRENKSNYYYRIGSILHSCNTSKISAIKYFILSILLYPINFRVYKSLFASLLPHSFYIKIKENFN